ncbi:MAG: hypothetical protein IPN34_02025 [Planctomycetes bacterium]|nr:hypothetical protein [Planctomycetota bacterium]
MRRGTAEDRKRGGRWVLLSTTAALLLFAAGPLPRSAAAPRSSLPHPPPLATRSVEQEQAATPPAFPRCGTPSPDRGPELDGAVVALDGPVPGLRVATSSATGIPATGAKARASFTDDAGCFRLRETASAPRRLIALGAEGAVLDGPLVPELVAERRMLRWDLDWRLVRVQLCQSTGQPLAGVALRCSSPAGAACFAVRHETDAEGRCAVLVRGASTIELAVERPSAAPASARFEAGSAEHLWTLPAL